MKGLEAWQSDNFGSHGPETLALTLPVQKPNVTVPVIELFLK
jgi:hypothetical protein